ncbi:tetratricopeptide repeat protein [Leptonema illini]|uniref:Uncharacterized protein n=1 Tax=Leptonema illini DSM 21528 TaxID=929563 RepID=H2CEA3_9LEPT|nr:DUF6880 family protein [Leptonema illini]EHQ07658.1 hypothetical protein Lepil_2993 [Leptonema illini DSM 21528]
MAQSEYDRVKEWLDRAPRELLVRLLWDQALSNDEFFERLSDHVTLAQSSDGDSAIALMIRTALTVDGFLDYHAMRPFVRVAQQVADLLASHLTGEGAAATLPLAHLAMKLGIEAYQKGDDSSGRFGEVLRLMAATHLEAATGAQPDPVAFAEDLFELSIIDDWRFFPFKSYSPLLKEDGLNRYRQLVQEEWDGLSSLEPDQRPARGSRFIVTSMMEEMARQSGDVDGLIDIKIKSQSLSHAFGYLEIAQILHEANRSDESLDWAERGLAAFPDRPDSRLIEFLAAEYARRGRHNNAIAVVWTLFNDRPDVESYGMLKTQAEAVGEWAKWRERAFSYVRKNRTGQQESKPSYHLEEATSTIVRILLFEGDPLAALKEARAGKYDGHLWFDIAEALEPIIATESVRIYQERIDDIIDLKGNRAYDRAADLVRHIRKLMTRLHRQEEFLPWLDTVRRRHKAKSNFMKRIEGIR